MLSSKRLLFRKFESQDLIYYTKLNTNFEGMQYITGRVLDETEIGTKFENLLRINEQDPEMGVFVVSNITDNEFIGLAKLTIYENDFSQAEVGYSMLPQFWGKGYGSEMLLAMMDLANEIPFIKTLIGIIDPSNKASEKILTNQNFTFYKSAPCGELPGAFYKLDIN